MFAFCWPHRMRLCDGADTSLTAVPLYDSLGESAVEVGDASLLTIKIYAYFAAPSPV